MANLTKRRGESIGGSHSKVETTAVGVVQAPKTKRVKTQHVGLDEYHQAALYDIRMTRQEQMLYEYQQAAEKAQTSEYQSWKDIQGGASRAALVLEIPAMIGCTEERVGDGRFRRRDKREMMR